MRESVDLMERLYRVFPWGEDPESFKRRVEEGERLLVMVKVCHDYELARRKLRITETTVKAVRRRRWG